MQNFGQWLLWREEHFAQWYESVGRHNADPIPIAML